jgi:hypothetical protein
VFVDVVDCLLQKWFLVQCQAQGETVTVAVCVYLTRRKAVAVEEVPLSDLGCVRAENVGKFCVSSSDTCDVLGKKSNGLTGREENPLCDGV